MKKQNLEKANFLVAKIKKTESLIQNLSESKKLIKETNQNNEHLVIGFYNRSTSTDETFRINASKYALFALIEIEIQRLLDEMEECELELKKL